jgi:hypothetical protein
LYAIKKRCLGIYYTCMKNIWNITFYYYIIKWCIQVCWENYDWNF